MKKAFGHHVDAVIETYTHLFTPYCCGLIADEIIEASNQLCSVSQVQIAFTFQAV